MIVSIFDGGIMKKIVKVFGALCIAFAAAQAFAAGPTSAKGAPVTMKITTWTSNKDQIALLNSFVEEFAQKKGIAVKADFETIPFGEYTAKLSLELQGNAAPDVFWILETSAPAFIRAKTLANLSNALASYNRDDLSESALELWKSGKAVYAVPFSTSPFFILYNADLLKKAGVKTPEQMIKDGTWTWENFRTMCKQIKDKTGVWAYQTVDGGGYGDRILRNLCPIIRSYGGDAWQGNKVLINTPESVKAISLFHNMVFKDRSVVPPGDQSDFYAGNAAMTVGQVSRVSKLVSAPFAWGMAPMPAGPKGNIPVIGQAAIAANARGKKAALASELVAYMTSESCAARMAGIWPPARKSVLASAAFLSSNPNVKPEQMKASVADSIATGRVLPSHALYTQIQVESRMVWDKLWKADADVKAVVDEVAKVYSKYIK